MMQRCASKNADYDDYTQDLARANVPQNNFSLSNSIVKASGCACSSNGTKISKFVNFGYSFT